MLWAFLVALLPNVQAAAAPSELGRLYSAQGTVEKRPGPQATWDKAQVGTVFSGRHACRTGLDSRGAVLFVDGVLVRLNENTLIEFYDPSANLPVGVGAGKAYFFSREPRRFPLIQTPTVSAAVRGTEFVVDVQPNLTLITVLEGEVRAQNALGFVDAGPGELVIAALGAAPVKQILIRPWDAVQWALYYPAVLDVAELTRLGLMDPASEQAVQQAAVAYQAGNLSAAFAALNLIPDPKPLGPALFQSALYLAVGQVEKAEALLTTLEQAVAAAPLETRSAFVAISRAQQAIVAVVNNDREEALQLAQAAVAANPRSAAAALTMSYVQQSLFELGEALRWARQAMALAPASGVVFARLAELYLGRGELGKAVKVIEQGLRAEPNDSRVLTVAGFSYVTRYQTARALELFEAAIRLDDSASLPHLGRGLALIRRNKLEEGRRELEFAVHLAPRDSLTRSYLGKAFFEEKRDGLAAKEYDLAQEFDPLDPTPYLYSALQKLGNYRPVEALWDIEDSIRLNDNRAVYRSRLLLDQDLAVRSAGLSQVFNQIGFTEAGRSEAIKSINRDYGNFSAHLLLAGSYFDRPQLNQAAISEQLVYRLLAPVNINSVRGDASFNEYSSLFDRQRVQAFLLSEGRSADRFIQAAPRVTMASDRFAVGVVYGARYQGGFRDNDDAELFAPGLLAQYQVTPSDTLSLETLQFESEQGDTAISYNPNLNDPDFRRRLESFTQRVGWHHRFGPRSHLIGQALYLERNTEIENFLEPALASPGTYNRTENLRSHGIRGDLQYIWDTSKVSLVGGAGVLDGEDEKQDSTVAEIFPFPVASSGTTPAESQRAYLYATWHLPAKIDLTVGGTYSRVRFGQVSVAPYDDQIHTADALDPKVGAVVRLGEKLTVRGGYFETLGGAGDTDLERLEPSQVAGLNQLFDEPAGTRARTVATALDYKLAKQTYAGVEASWREQYSPFGFHFEDANGGLDPLLSGRLQAHERGLRSYAYHVLHRTTTATLDYTAWQREDDSSRLPAIGDPTDDGSLTHRVRIGLNYFDPQGWFTGAAATWRWQHLENFDPGEEVANGTRDFWIFDLTMGFQFPKRSGFIALSLNNIFSRDFRYQPVGIDQLFLPDASANMRLSLNF